MTEEMIRDAYCRMRTIDQTIPDDVLDFMKDASIESIKRSDSDGGNKIHQTHLRMSSFKKLIDISQRRELLINFFEWINQYESLHYTEKGVNFYVDEYLKHKK